MTCEQGLLRLLWGGAQSWSATALGNGIVISSPDDLFHHDIDVDFAKLDRKHMLINEGNHITLKIPAKVAKAKLR